MEKNSYLYSINRVDENVYDILNNEYVDWELHFASLKGNPGDKIYFYVTGNDENVDSFLNFHQQVVYVAEIIKIEPIDFTKKKAVKLKFFELTINQVAQLSLSDFRKIIKGFEPSRSYPIDLQENRYIPLKEYIEKVCSSEVVSTDEERFLNDFKKYVYFFIDKFKKSKSRSWGKLKGDISLRLLKDFINKKLSLINSQYESSELNSYIAGFPTEFDLLIVKKNRNHFPLFSNIYNPNDVKTIIEVKTSGIIASKDSIKDKFKRMSQDIEIIKLKYSNINFVYLTIFERANTKSKESMNYLLMTQEGLYPHKVFCILDVYSGFVRQGELSKFIEEIK